MEYKCHNCKRIQTEVIVYTENTVKNVVTDRYGDLECRELETIEQCTVSCECPSCHKEIDPCVLPQYVYEFLFDE